MQNDIFVIDHLSPESTAMLLALYSRSSAGVQTHLKKIKDKGSSNFMREHYSGYGHKSIGDCGETAIFLEGWSILSVKALQNSPLFRGQEVSTRYIDMANQPIHDPVNNTKSQRILGMLMDFYRKAGEPLKSDLRLRYPFVKPDESKKMESALGTYERAIKAKSFDILRGMLPAGITTMVGWKTDLRQAYDRLRVMVHHPLAEVRKMASETLAQLKVKYPDSFAQKVYPDSESYIEKSQRLIAYLPPDTSEARRETSAFTMHSEVDHEEAQDSFGEMLSTRPAMTELPYELAQLGTIKSEFCLDYGSWRDIQRHRNGVCRVTILDTSLGYHPWYLNQLTNELRDEATRVLTGVNNELMHSDVSEHEKQYLTPMGYTVRSKISYGIPAWAYMLELRSTRSVHPTLRSLVHKLGAKFTELHPYVKLHLDHTKSDWDVKRGDQTLFGPLMEKVS